MQESVDIIRLDEPREGVPEVINKQIDEAVAALAAGHGSFSVDTERAMGIRYSDRAYLVQIRREGAGTFLIDPVGIEERLGGLAEVLAQDEWILHAADQDLPCLRQLGLEPPRIFDTELAGLLLGFPRVSLQAEIAEVLGFGLAKEHSHSDWSARPLSRPLRAYAALDVELLLELRDALTHMLRTAGRLSWLEQECEEVRLRPPRPTPTQPWRKAARQANVTDRRSLAMLEGLWNRRDELARQRDIAPEKVIPAKVLAILALHKPRSRQDVLTSPLFQRRSRRRDAAEYWDAIAPIWHIPIPKLPVRYFVENRDPFPPMRQWARSHPEAEERWKLVRACVFSTADDLGIRQDILLKPALQKLLAWEGWEGPVSIYETLIRMGARPWQVDHVGGAIAEAVRKSPRIRT